MLIDRYYQTEAVDSIFDYFRNNSGNPVVAMPTGTGKSVVIARFFQRAMSNYANQRFLMATHVKELIAQNARAFQKAWPDAPAGIYSAGLGIKDTMQPIIFGGVKSIINNLDAFGRRDLMVIDEGHLLSPKEGTGYREVIKHFKTINPYFKVILFTATGYRLGQGLLTDDVTDRNGKVTEAIATDFCYDITGLTAFNKLVSEGYISPLISFSRDIGLDLSSVGINNLGEFNQNGLQIAVDRDEITLRALTECASAGANRGAWLLFASGVKHSENIAAMLNNRFGISAATIHSEITAGERTARIQAFKRGQLRCLVNMNVLTTGFDFPPIDFIGMLRPTMSPGLWVQMLGRGTRPYDPANPGDVDPNIWRYLKANCLVLDFAGNAARLGPINDPRIPQRKGKGKGPIMVPLKQCEACGADNHISVRQCVNCGAEFTFEVKITEKASQSPVMAIEEATINWHKVVRVFYYPYETRSKGDKLMKVSYHCEHMYTWEEFVWFADSSSKAQANKGKHWWHMRMSTPVPLTAEEALKQTANFKEPTRIKVHENKKPYPDILNVEFDIWQQSDASPGKSSEVFSVFG